MSINPIPVRRTQEQKRNLEYQWHLCYTAHRGTWICIYAGREREREGGRERQGEGGRER